jgi:ribose 5-phosphate isomerase B
MNIFIGSDHAGYMLKEKIKEYLTTHNSYSITDVGCFNQNSCDYPIIADKLCIKLKLYDVGILVCGTGLGMSIKANRYKYIRCGLCYNVETAELGRKHNNINILALGARIINYDEALKIVDVFLNTKFEGGRHENRINML